MDFLGKYKENIQKKRKHSASVLLFSIEDACYHNSLFTILLFLYGRLMKVIAIDDNLRVLLENINN